MPLLSQPVRIDPPKQTGPAAQPIRTDHHIATGIARRAFLSGRADTLQSAKCPFRPRPPVGPHTSLTLRAPAQGSRLPSLAHRVEEAAAAHSVQSSAGTRLPICDHVPASPPNPNTRVLFLTSERRRRAPTRHLAPAPSSSMLSQRPWNMHMSSHCPGTLTRPQEPLRPPRALRRTSPGGRRRGLQRVGVSPPRPHPARALSRPGRKPVFPHTPLHARPAFPASLPRWSGHRLWILLHLTSKVPPVRPMY